MKTFVDEGDNNMYEEEKEDEEPNYNKVYLKQVRTGLENQMKKYRKEYNEKMLKFSSNCQAKQTAYEATHKQQIEAASHYIE